MIDETTQDGKHGQGVAATGSVIGAVLASSCCRAPLVLITLGASGPWIGKLTALKEYQPIFVTLTAGFLGYGFWKVYGSAGTLCDSDTCATPVATRIVKIALWAAAVLVVLALTTDYWASLFY